MSRRSVLLVVSILLAAIGTALVGLYVRSADQRAASGAGLVQVLVAARDLAAGTQVTAADFTTVAVPSDVLPAGALGLAGRQALAGQRANAEVHRLDYALADKFSKQGNEATLTGVDPKLGEIAINLDTDSRVSGAVTNGSLVDIWMTPDDPTKKSAPLVLNVKVLWVGATPAGTTRAGATGVPANQVMLEVNRDAAAAIHDGLRQGSLWLYAPNSTTTP